MELAVLFAQLVATSLIGAWLTTGVWDNLRYPEMNESYTADVFSMQRMKQDYPHEYAMVSHRAINSRRIQLLAFRLVVIAEITACLILWCGAVALAIALIGVGSVENARVVALLGATAFTGVWGAFLVVGNYFSYWFCHEGAQNTHYQMTLWGLGTMLVLMSG